MSATHGRLGWLSRCGLAVIAVAAASLSFASLRSLAMLAGTPSHLAWLYPLTLDATMMVATRMWVGVDVPHPARRFARLLALATIALSVAGNAGQHWLTGGGDWWPVVVGAVPAAVLAAVAHLVALTVQHPAPTPADAPASPTTPAEVAPTVDADPADTEQIEAAPAEDHQDVASPSPATPEVGDQHLPAANPAPTELGDDLASLVSRARQLVADAEAEGRHMGRGNLARELGIKEHRVRQVQAAMKDDARPTLHAVGGG